MINIQRYREMLVELKERVNKVSRTKIDGTVIAVSEKHLVKQLRDCTGLMLCANYPDAVSQGNEDNYREQNSLLLFLIEKVPSGQETKRNCCIMHTSSRSCNCLKPNSGRWISFAEKWRGQRV